MHRRGIASARVRAIVVRANGSAVMAGLLAAASCLALSADVEAQDGRGGVLAECAALSPMLDDIHICLDNYLDVMDDNLADVSTFIERSIDGEAKAAFAKAQRAFATYRRDNCLWYLEFSTPRSDAEQLAKDCLADMSLQRLSELQRLIADNDGDNAVHGGYYVYGANRNTFRPCGSDARYWVEGDAASVGELQQTYLDTATTDLQVLFASVRGELDELAEAPSGHDGVLSLSALSDLRLPREADCRLPAGGPVVTTIPASETASGDAIDTDDDIAAAEPGDAVADADPEQQLIAYFGAWLADCTETASLRLCRLSTELDRADGEGSVTIAETANDVAGDTGLLPTVTIARRASEVTVVELRFPGREIDSPEKIRWRIDTQSLGEIIGSSIRVDATAGRQLIADPDYVNEELLPKLINGATLHVDVLDAADDRTGDEFTATLIGLTRALDFADDFVRDDF